MSVFLSFHIQLIADEHVSILSYTSKSRQGSACVSSVKNISQQVSTEHVSILHIQLIAGWQSPSLHTHMGGGGWLEPVSRQKISMVFFTYSCYVECMLIALYRLGLACFVLFWSAVLLRVLLPESYWSSADMARPARLLRAAWANWRQHARFDPFFNLSSPDPKR